MVRVAPLALLLLAACPEPADEADALQNRVATLRIQLRQLEITARQYDESMSVALESTCIGTHRTYDLQARMLVMNATAVAPDLDAAITAHGGEAYADIGCTVAEVERERSYHGALACQELALADNQTEAGRHLVALGVLVEHLYARAAEIEAGLAEMDLETWTWSLPPRCP